MRPELNRGPSLDSELRHFIDAVIVPALLERFLREHAAAEAPAPREFQEPETTV